MTAETTPAGTAGRQADPKCILCQIAEGRLRADKIIETDNVIGMINDVEPLSRGHCVFFPKRYASKLHNGSLANQTVFHMHVHLIPKWSDAEGLRFHCDLPKSIDQKEIAQRIKAKLLLDPTVQR